VTRIRFERAALAIAIVPVGAGAGSRLRFSRPPGLSRVRIRIPIISPTTTAPGAGSETGANVLGHLYPSGGILAVIDDRAQVEGTVGPMTVEILPGATSGSRQP
jgi:hypothetical protein